MIVTLFRIILEKKNGNLVPLLFTGLLAVFRVALTRSVCIRIFVRRGKGGTFCQSCFHDLARFSNLKAIEHRGSFDPNLLYSRDQFDSHRLRLSSSLWLLLLSIFFFCLLFLLSINLSSVYCHVTFPITNDGSQFIVRPFGTLQRRRD